MTTTRVVLPTLHADQVRVHHLKSDARAGDWEQNAGGRFMAIRCGRRWGKSTYGETWLGDGATKGKFCGVFAPDYKKLTEIYYDLSQMLAPIIPGRGGANKTEGVIRTRTGGRIDFWTLENESAGRSRKYHRVFIDEGAFTKPNMMDVWKRAIKPTLLDYGGWAKVASNTNGVDPENFLYAICNDPQHGFIEAHAPSISNPLIPLRMDGESAEDHMARRVAEFESIRAREHPLVFKQEYLAEFVDWSGVAFFELSKMLDRNGLPAPYPRSCDAVFAVMDSATKTGTANDGTAVTYWAYGRNLSVAGTPQLVLLDWEIIQIQGAMLEVFLPQVIQNLETLARTTGARAGSVGVHIEDKSSGEVLLQQAANRNLLAHPIDSRLTAMGKDERAISVSGYVYRGEVKLSDVAYNKTVVYKGTSRNHLVSQVTGFRIGDKDAAKRADDLLDAFCYGIILSLGNSAGF